jgi:hypothetical protein
VIAPVASSRDPRFTLVMIAIAGLAFAISYLLLR